MLNMRRTAFAIGFASVIMTSGFSSSANACGLLGCIVNQIVPGAGDVLDDVHRRLGNPLDQAGAVAAQYYGVPVSPHCATPQGVFVGAWLPIGIACNANGIQGVVVP